MSSKIYILAALLLLLTGKGSAGNDTIAVADSSERFVDSMEITIDENGDTVFVLPVNDVTYFTRLGTIRGGGVRERGVSLAPALGVSGLDLGPMRKVMKKCECLADFEPSLSRHWAPMLLVGAKGYFGFRGGVRIGGWVRAGRRTFTLPESADEEGQMRVSLLYGGPMIEKCVVRRSMNLFGGVVFGAGVMHLSGKRETTPDASHTAIMLTPSLHLGGTYTLLRWLHVGLESHLSVMYSTTGFSSETGLSIGPSFLIVYPGLSIRAVFGSLG